MSLNSIAISWMHFIKNKVKKKKAQLTFAYLKADF